MLNNNDECNWSIFLEKPLEISLATLSKYMNILKRNGHVKKVSKGLYKISPKGKKRFYEIKHKESFGNELKYPPDLIYKKHNYSHIILWMLFNNGPCKWADFLNKPLSINSHSLSKNLNILIKDEFVEIIESNYQITKSGEKEYSKILKIYNLDYQSILEEDLKKVERVKEELKKFFNEWSIQDDNIKIIFLDLLNQIEYDDLKDSISSKKDFYKILLYLSINNLTRYPEFISLLDFANTHDIRPPLLEFYLQKFLEGSIFQGRFFKLEVDENQIYYFRVSEKIEKMILLIIDENVKNYCFTNLLDLNTSASERKNHSKTIFKNIINDISINLFDKSLKIQIISFLSDYLLYLYDDLKKQIPKDLNDKFKILVFQDIVNLDEQDIEMIKNQIFQLTPLLRNFPKYKILEEIKKNIQYSNFS